MRNNAENLNTVNASWPADTIMIQNYDTLFDIKRVKNFYHRKKIHQSLFRGGGRLEEYPSHCR